MMLEVLLVAWNSIKSWLKVKPYVKTSLSPESEVFSCYLEEAGVQKYLEEMEFKTDGYWCITIIRNPGELLDKVTNDLKGDEVIFAAVLSRNRNFKGVVHLLSRVCS